MKTQTPHYHHQAKSHCQMWAEHPHSLQEGSPSLWAAPSYWSEVVAQIAMKLVAGVECSLV